MRKMDPVPTLSKYPVTTAAKIFHYLSGIISFLSPHQDFTVVHNESASLLSSILKNVRLKPDFSTAGAV